MRYLVIGDIHSNIEALQAVVQCGSYDRILVLGDLVGYGASPEETVQRVRELDPAAIVRGNHDKVVAGLERGEHFSALALKAAHWTQEHLSEESLQYLRTLPVGPVTAAPGIALTHGSPRHEDEYLFPSSQVRPAFGRLATPLCFFGHTHLPTLFFQAGKTIICSQIWAPLKTHLSLASERYLINPGSVGQPRDRDPRAACAIFDNGDDTIEFFRVGYDIAAAQQKIRDAGLPDGLWRRLERGA
jgi:diadenosine tetraphosphatase ApaH/serine/threonine PP2A family protein phosphatase